MHVYMKHVKYATMPPHDLQLPHTSRLQTHGGALGLKQGRCWGQIGKRLLNRSYMFVDVLESLSMRNTAAAGGAGG